MWEKNFDKGLNRLHVNLHIIGCYIVAMVYGYQIVSSR